VACEVTAESTTCSSSLLEAAAAIKKLTNCILHWCSVH